MPNRASGGRWRRAAACAVGERSSARCVLAPGPTCARRSAGSRGARVLASARKGLGRGGGMVGGQRARRPRWRGHTGAQLPAQSLATISPRCSDSFIIETDSPVCSRRMVCGARGEPASGAASKGGAGRAPPPAAAPPRGPGSWSCSPAPLPARPAAPSEDGGTRRHARNSRRRRPCAYPQRNRVCHHHFDQGLRAHPTFQRPGNGRAEPKVRFRTESSMRSTAGELNSLHGVRV